jgi:hypothetical protein
MERVDATILLMTPLRYVFTKEFAQKFKLLGIMMSICFKHHRRIVLSKLLCQKNSSGIALFIESLMYNWPVIVLHS